RRADAGHATHRQRTSFHDHFAHQGDERTRYIRASSPAGRPFPRQVQPARHRLPCIDHALDSRRRRRAARTRQRVDEREFRTLTLDVVGFGEDDLRKFRRYIAEPYGMVLVTGPTGSGKTTTLYAAVNEIKTDEDKIITIEDPVE